MEVAVVRIIRIHAELFQAVDQCIVEFFAAIPVQNLRNVVRINQFPNGLRRAVRQFRQICSEDIFCCIQHPAVLQALRPLLEPGRLISAVIGAGEPALHQIICPLDQRVFSAVINRNGKQIIPNPVQALLQLGGVGNAQLFTLFSDRILHLGQNPLGSNTVCTVVFGNVVDRLNLSIHRVPIRNGTQMIDQFSVQRLCHGAVPLRVPAEIHDPIRRRIGQRRAGLNVPEIVPLRRAVFGNIITVHMSSEKVVQPCIGKTRRNFVIPFVQVDALNRTVVHQTMVLESDHRIAAGPCRLRLSYNPVCKAVGNPASVHRLVLSIDRVVGRISPVVYGDDRISWPGASYIGELACLRPKGRRIVGNDRGIVIGNRIEFAELLRACLRSRLRFPAFGVVVRRVGTVDVVVSVDDIDVRLWQIFLQRIQLCGKGFFADIFPVLGQVSVDQDNLRLLLPHGIQRFVDNGNVAVVLLQVIGLLSPPVLGVRHQALIKQMDIG